MNALRAKVQSLKDAIQSSLKEIEIAKAQTAKSSQFFDDGFSSDSDEEFSYTIKSSAPPSELRLQERMLKTCVQATQELTSLQVLQSEVNMIVEPPKIKHPPMETGSWQEVTVDCRVDLIPFSMVFVTFQPYRKFSPTSYYKLAVTPVKAAHEVELSQSVLPSLTRPSDAVEVVRSYSVASRSRRESLARLADKYGHSLYMEPNKSEGGYTLKCADLMKVSWRLQNKWSPIAPFHHRMTFDLEYMDESYIKIIRRAHKALSEPGVDTEERTAILSTIINTCLEAQKPTQELYESMSSDPETAKSLRKRRTTLDQHGDDNIPKKVNEIHQNVKEDEIMAPPKSLPKKTKPKGKENVVNNDTVNKNVSKETNVDDNPKKSRVSEKTFEKNTKVVKEGPLKSCNDEVPAKKSKVIEKNIDNTENRNLNDVLKDTAQTKANANTLQENEQKNNAKPVKRPIPDTNSKAPIKKAKTAEKSVTNDKNTVQESDIVKTGNTQKKNFVNKEVKKSTDAVKNNPKKGTTKEATKNAVDEQNNNGTRTSKTDINKNTQNIPKNAVDEQNNNGTRTSKTNINKNTQNIPKNAVDEQNNNGTRTSKTDINKNTQNIPKNAVDEQNNNGTRTSKTNINKNTQNIPKNAVDEQNNNGTETSKTNYINKNTQNIPKNAVHEQNNNGARTSKTNINKNTQNIPKNNKNKKQNKKLTNDMKNKDTTQTPTKSTTKNNDVKKTAIDTKNNDTENINIDKTTKNTNPAKQLDNENIDKHTNKSNNIENKQLKKLKPTKNMNSKVDSKNDEKNVVNSKTTNKPITDELPNSKPNIEHKKNSKPIQNKKVCDKPKNYGKNNTTSIIEKRRSLTHASNQSITRKNSIRESSTKTLISKTSSKLAKGVANIKNKVSKIPAIMSSSTLSNNTTGNSVNTVKSIKNMSGISKISTKIPVPKTLKNKLSGNKNKV